MSARDDLTSRQKGFRLGIDDYMVKPVELVELEMRVRALLRRAKIETERKIVIGNLEKEKSWMAIASSITVGIIGTAFLPGSVFAITASPPILWLCVMLAIPGFIGWVLPFFLYQGIKRRKTDRVNLLIEKKYDEITGLMQKGHSLL